MKHRQGLVYWFPLLRKSRRAHQMPGKGRRDTTTLHPRQHRTAAASCVCVCRNQRNGIRIDFVCARARDVRRHRPNQTNYVHDRGFHLSQRTRTEKLDTVRFMNPRSRKPKLSIWNTLLASFCTLRLCIIPQTGVDCRKQARDPSAATANTLVVPHTVVHRSIDISVQVLVVGKCLLCCVRRRGAP